MSHSKYVYSSAAEELSTSGRDKFSSFNFPGTSLLYAKVPSDSLSLLPTCPKLFYGREVELEMLVETLASAPPRTTILGPGGTGKTTLAMAALHHPTMVEKYTFK